MRPVLEAAAARDYEVSILEIADEIAVAFNLTETELAEKISTGTQQLFYNRLHWAKTYLKKAGLIDSAKRGKFGVTEAGKALLATHSGQINNATLDAFPAFKAWKSAKAVVSDLGQSDLPLTGHAIENSQVTADLSPDDMITEGIKQIETTLVAALLDRLKSVHPKRFEAVVVELLKAMGFGGKPGSVSKVTSYSGDGGIDGIIGEDVLGLDAVYIQAKRYKDTCVGQPAIQQFVGSMDGEGAHKGVFVTTSTFTKQALSYVEKTSKRVVLIDGPRLADLCMRYGVGVREKSAFQIRIIDEEFFDGED